MIRYSLKQLRYFVAAAELRSTCGAARLLHVSQPSISAAIKQLEESFGQTLVIRHKGQGVIPTPYGRQLMIRAKHLLNMASNLSTDCTTETAGSVLLGSFTDISPYYLPGILQGMQQQYPDIEARIVNTELHEIPIALKRGDMDLAITYGVLLEDGLIYQRLKTVEPHAMLPVDHALAALERIPLARLLEEPFVLSDGPYSSDLLLVFLSGLGLVPKVAHNVQTFELQRGMVANHLGVSLVYTQPLCSKSYDGKELVFRPVQEALPTQDIVLVRNDYLELTPVTAAVWQLVINCFSEQSEYTFGS